jgi:hypothetical protein
MSRTVERAGTAAAESGSRGASPAWSWLVVVTATSALVSILGACATVGAAAGAAAVPAGMAIAKAATEPSPAGSAKVDPAERTVGAADPYTGEVPKTVAGQPGPNAWPSPGAPSQAATVGCPTCGSR